MMMDCLCRPSRIMSVRINLLDETDFIHEIKDDLPGQALLDVVFARLNLIETSYFGIRYIDEENQTHWLDPASRISRQLKPKADAYDLYFGVKFYAADPCKLLEEITRYQLFLQVKQDVLQGRLPVAFELAAELGAFVVQSELGDYDQRRHSKGYVSEFRLLPNQSNELETRVSELHQQLKGMSPATAELNYLDKVKWHDMYGVDLHPVLGEDSVEYFLGLTPSGIVVLRNKTTVAHYYWPRIAKVYYKGRYFMLRISDKNNELSTYGFETPRKSACKHLWRCCVEHHAFFRLVRVAPLPNSQSNTSELFQIGTRLRYSGRSTEKQSIKDALSIGRTPPAFTRVPSKRQPRRVMDDFLNGGPKSVETYSNVGTLLGGGGKGGAGIMTTNYESPYRSTYSIPTSLGIRPYQQQPLGGPSQTTHSNYSGVGSNLQTPDSPRSTRSAPWPRSQQRSLFGNNPSSPRSVRSARTTRTTSSGGGGGGTGSGHHHHHHNANNHHHSDHQQQHSRSQPDQQVPSNRYRSSSVESHSSNDSRSTRRHKNRHRRTSDNESELSRGSGRSGRSHHRKHRRSRHRHESAGSDHESARGRSYSGHRSSSQRSGSAELIDSTSQWREVQRRQAEASLGQSSVQQASVSKSSIVARSLHSNDSHSDTHSHHKSRHRHRSKNKSPSDSRSRIWSSELARHLQFGLVDTTGMSEDQLREIPYTVVETNSKRSTSNLKIHKSNSKSSVGGKSTGSGNTLTNGSGSMNGQGKNRVDRIRGSLYYQNSNPTESATTKNGSIRSASTISSRECERNTGLVRMMSSMSMGDFISPTGSNLSPLENSALRVSHEHTDSGLGADQDYAYSSERSSDSTRYGTNKSSGASSGSHRKPAGTGSTTTAYNSLIQQSVSNQQQQQHQNQHQQQLSQRQNAHSFYGPQRAHQKSSNASTKPLAPIHNLLASSNSSTSPPAGLASIKNQQTNTTTTATTPCSSSSPPTNNSISSRNANESKTSSGSKHNNSSAGNRLLSYTTFENNQYKFSLNNVFGKGASSNGNGNGNGNSNANAPHGVGGMGRINNHIDSFPEWPNNPAAPYYYNGPSTSNTNNMKRRDAKSDIGVRTRRLSGGQSSMGPSTAAITKTQLLSGHFGNASGCYPLNGPDGSAYTTRLNGGGLGGALHPAKSDLFLSYIHTAASAAGDYERPYIYNYKMPQMPDFLRTASGNQQQPKGAMPPLPPQQSNTAYHISGAQTADPPQLYKPSDTGSSGTLTAATSVGIYGGAKPATDVMYYQFDNGRPPIVQQPKSLLSKTANSGAGPLVFVQHGQNVAPANATSTQQTSTTITNTNTTTAQATSTNNKNNNNNNESPCGENGNQDGDVFNKVNLVNNDDDDDDDNDYAVFDDGFKVEDPNFNLDNGNINNASNNNGSRNASNSTSSNEPLVSPCGPVGTSQNVSYGPTSTASLSVNDDGIDNCNAYTNGNPTSVSVGNGQQQQYQQHCTINNPNSSNSATAPTSTFNPVAVTNSNNWNANSALSQQQQSSPLQQQQQQQQQYTTQNFNQNPNLNRNPITVDHTTQNSNANSNSIAMQNQNPNISSSLEIILSPIIQSSRRAQ